MTTTNAKTNAALLAIAADFARADLAADNIAARLKAVMPEGRSTAEHDAALPILRAGYKTERGCSDEAAKKAIERLCKAAGIVRPKATSKAAVDKAAQRAKGATDTAAKVADLTAKADELVADAAKAREAGNIASAKRLELEAAAKVAKADELLEKAAKAATAALEVEVKKDAKTAREALAELIKADPTLAPVALWAARNPRAVVELMKSAQEAELAKSLASAGKVEHQAKPVAKPVERKRKAA